MPAEAAAAALREVARAAGTPAYAYDLEALERQAFRLREQLPGALTLLYSLKANPSLGLVGKLASWGFGADVASLGELLCALEAGVPPERIQFGGPYLARTPLDEVGQVDGILLSIDSASELRSLAAASGPRRHALLRLRPDFPVGAAVAMGAGSRFGIPFGQLSACRPWLSGGAVTVVGFHVHCGSQVLDAGVAVRHLRGAFDQALRAAEHYGIELQVLNLGGGFGVSYGHGDPELDLGVVGRELDRIVEQAQTAAVILELGRFLVAGCGWYLTRVVALQTHCGRPAVVVDGGVHQRSDLCGLGLRTATQPPVVLTPRTGPVRSTDVLGCLCLPDDVLAEACPLPRLKPGDLLAFPNAGAYGFSASPLLFLGHPMPAEIAFDGSHLHVLRARGEVASLLASQRPIWRAGPPSVRCGDPVA